MLFSNGPLDRMEISAPLDDALTHCHFVLPYTTVGIGFAVNQIYLHYYDQLSPHFTIFQLYRYTLSQLEFVRSLTHQTAITTVNYIDTYVALPDSLRSVVVA